MYQFIEVPVLQVVELAVSPTHHFVNQFCQFLLEQAIRSLAISLQDRTPMNAQLNTEDDRYC